jgi:serine/threonine protein kinase
VEAGQRIRDFLVEAKIGAGGVGEVWRAHHQHLDKPVALKAIYRHLAQEPRFRERFLLEATAMAKLDHPHIVAVHDFFVVDEVPYLVMSYIEGGSLADLLKRRGRLAVAEALPIARDILEALNYAHTVGVIHRDVKPSNILMRPDGHAYLVDFGIALVLGQPRVTRFGTNIGTPEYMSPEQIQAQALDHRTDVYSFGCVLYEMLTGQPPFGSADTGKTEFEIMNGHLHTPPRPLRELNPAVDAQTEAVVLRALAKDPNDRYGGCSALAEALGVQTNSSSPRAAASKPDSKRGTGNARRIFSPHSMFKKLGVIILLLAIVSVVIVWRIDRVHDGPRSIETEIFQKIDKGQLVVPVGGSAYDIWRKHINDDLRVLSRKSEERLRSILHNHGTKFFEKWKGSFSATDHEWLEVSRVYEWAVYLQDSQKDEKVNADITVEQSCSNLKEDMKYLCARYSYSVGQIDSRNGQLAEAAANYDRAQFYDKFMCLSYIGKAEIYIKEEKFANAEWPFQKAVECDRTLCDNLSKIGNLFTRRNIQDKARELYTKVCSKTNSYRTK